MGYVTVPWAQDLKPGETMTITSSTSDSPVGMIDEHGQLKGVELESRRDVYVRANKVAAIIALKDGGPCRLVLDAGGHIDVCGSAEIWRCVIRIVELQETRA